MQALYYVIGIEAVESLEDSFETFVEFLEENPGCLHTQEYETEKEMRLFVTGLSEMGYEKYSILTQEEVNKLKEKELA